MTFQIRNTQLEEFQLVRNWTVDQKWNPGDYDYIAFQSFGNDGFFMGTIDDEPMGTIGIVKYDQNYAFLGWFIVKEKFRKCGYGTQIIKNALEKITAKSIGLQGVLAQQHYYKKLGFVTQNMTVRYQIGGTNDQYTSQNIKKCSEISFEDLIKYDRQCFPSERRQFLQKWTNLPETLSLVYTQGNIIKGYGVMRKSSEGYRIGPLYADNIQVAKQLLKVFQGSISKQQPLFIDIPDNNKDSIQLTTHFNAKPGFTCARMYKGETPKIHAKEKIFGVSSLEFG